VAPLGFLIAIAGAIGLVLAFILRDPEELGL